MSQPPNSGQDPVYISGPPPGYGPAGGPGFPPPGQGFGPPPRRGRPWWVWALFGCGGCALLATLASVLLFVFGMNTFKSAMQDVGTVTEASVLQSLGADIPVYPQAQLDLDNTRMLVTTFRVAEKITGKPGGSIFGGAGFYRTEDAPEKVMQFYDKTLKKEGWQPLREQDTGFQQQHQFQKAGAVAIIQTQKDPASGGTQLTLMRGGSELVELNRRRSGQEAAPTPAR